VQDETLDAWERWYSDRTERRTGRAPAAKTLVGYRMRLRGAQRIGGYETSEHLAISLGNRAAVVQLMDRLYARQKPVTVHGVVQALRHLGEWAVAAGLIDASEIRKDDAPSHVPQKPVQVLSQADLAKLLLYARARNLRFWMLLATLSETGRRIGEMLALRYEDLRLEATPPHFDLPFTKAKRQQYVPLTRMLREEVWTPEHVERLKREPGHLRGTDERPFPWTWKGANHHLDRLCEAAEVRCDGFHLLRHTRATRLLERGVPLHAVSTLLGHSNTAVTERVYAHCDALAFHRYVDDES
jgi:integrase